MSIALIVHRTGMKPNCNEYSFPDDLFHHFLISFYDKIKEFKTSVVASNQSTDFPIVDVDIYFPVRWDVPFLIMLLARSVTSHTPRLWEAFNISATTPKGPAAFPFFLLIIIFATILIVMSMGGPTTG